MGILGWFLAIILVLIAFFTLSALAARKSAADRPAGSFSKDELAKINKKLKNGIKLPSDLKLICPHCKMTGSVTTTKNMKAVGISGAKVTGAILTGGLSVAATGLSRKDLKTTATCKNCNSIWQF